MFVTQPFVAFDRGFNDYNWFETLDTLGIFFVTRLKNNTNVSFLKKRRGRKAKGVAYYQKIKFDDILKQDASCRLVVLTSQG